jgi:hypothetical protein
MQPRRDPTKTALWAVALALLFARSASAHNGRRAREGRAFGDAILRVFDRGRFIPRSRIWCPGAINLCQDRKAAIMTPPSLPSIVFEAYRIEHPETKIRTSGYYLPIVFDVALAGLTSAKPLIARASAVLDTQVR